MTFPWFWSDILGRALLHFVWQGIAAAAVLRLALFAVPRARAGVRYVLACITLAIMAAAPVATMWALSVADAAPSATRLAVAPVPIETNLARPAAAGELGASPTQTATRAVPQGWTAWVVFLWMLGVALTSLRLAGGWSRSRKLLRHDAFDADPVWVRTVGRLSLGLGIRQALRVLESARVQVPVVIGVLKPSILLPLGALGGFSPAQIEALLAHELAHIRRHDYLVNLLQSVAEALLFYHPAVWWVSNTIRVEREHCCDDIAVAACGDALLYARALTELEARRPAGVGLAMAASSGSLLSRVGRLLGGPPPRQLASSAWVIAAVTAVMVAGAGAVSWVQHLSRVMAQSSERPAAAVQKATDHESAIAAPAVSRPTASVLGDEFPEVPPTPLPPTPIAAPGPPPPASPAPDAFNLFEAFVDLLAVPPPPPTGVLPAVPAPPSPALAPAHPAPPPPPPAARGATPAAPPKPAVPATPSAPPTPPPPLPGTIDLSNSPDAWVSRFSTNRLTTTLRGKGRIEFTDDDTDVKRLDPAGFFEIEQSRGWFSWKGATRFTARGDADGTISRTFVIDGKTVTQDEGRRWLRTNLPTLIRQTGIGARARVARILEQSGPDGVLREIAQIGGWAKHVYFLHLFEQATLDTPTLTRALEQAGREVQSDFELRMILQHASARFTLDSTTGAAYVNAARTVDSDFEQRHALAPALAQPALPADAAGSLLNVAAAGLDSDFEMAELLIRMPPTAIRAAAAAYVAAANTIESDFEHRRALTALVSRPAVDAALVDGALRSSGAHMESDFELASFLTDYVRKQGLAEAHRKAFFDAVTTLESDFERRRVLTALAGRSGLQDGDIAAIAASVGQMGSDFERAEALLAVIAHQRLSPAARDAVLGATRGIGSDHERGRVLSAMLQRGALTTAAGR